jgi:hypothetical protein
MGDDILSCPICLERFNESAHCPLILGCGHSFCRECIVSLHTNKREIKCPHCNQVDSRTPEKLPKNFIICDMLLKAMLLSNSESDPWKCKSHTGETLSYISLRSKEIFCPDCLVNRNHSDIVPLNAHLITSQLKKFKDLYGQSNPSDLEKRAEIFNNLSEAIEGNRIRVINGLDYSFVAAAQTLENQYKTFKRRVLSGLEKEKTKLQDCKQLMTLLRDMKRVNVPLDEIGQKLQNQRMLHVMGSFMSLNELGNTSDLKQVLNNPIEFHNRWDVPSKLLEVPMAICETPLSLLQGVGSGKDTGEKKLARFNTPTNRWGIFEGKNQIEAVTFSVDQKVFMTGLGVGNSYHASKTVSLENLRVLEGPDTDSPIKYEHGVVTLYNDPSKEKVVKIPFRTPIELQPNVDYTVRIVLRGDSGVFRGGSTTRTRAGPDGVSFRFRSANYTGDDVKNGENADDGPIFDIYYKSGLDLESAQVKITRFREFEGVWGIRDNQVEAFAFSFDKNIILSAVGISNSISENACSVQSVRILKGNSTSGEPVYSSDSVVPLRAVQNETTRINMVSEVRLMADQVYTIRIVIKGKAGLYKPKGFKGPVIKEAGVHMRCMEAQYALNENSEGENHQDGPILDFYCIQEDTNFSYSLGEIPNNFVELAGGECKLTRFEGIDKQWHLNTDNQVESFTFSFSEDVLLTALGLGNCIKLGAYLTVENIQILYGNSTIGPIIFNSTQVSYLYNHSDTQPIIKTNLETPVRLQGKTNYTFRIIIRGDGKSYKGQKFRGATLTQPDGIVFKCSKSIMGGNDKRNGDNESAGPMFDIYYIPLERNYNIDSFNSLLGMIFPRMKKAESVSAISPAATVKIAEDLLVARYTNTGASWHINTDGKQVEAIAFKVNKNIKLTAVGIGNAHEEGKKVTARKIQIRQGKSTRSPSIYKHSSKEKMINVGEESRFVKVNFDSPVNIRADTWYTFRVKYKTGTPVCRGTGVNNSPSAGGVDWLFEKATFERDVENGSHEIHGPLRDFYFTL